MSKAINQKYKTIIDLLAQVTKQVLKLIETNRIEECIVLLGDCQESAIALGSHIEKIHGLNTKPVQALEQYCENLYKVSVEIEQGQYEGAAEELVRSMERIEKSYLSELECRREIVFMPYKAAMWDSLESVWMAAEADPDCDVYVVPMAYYDRNPDQSLGEYHYEGDLFPEEVQITYYEDYDFAERQPDVIYIHNPYDWANNATSVDPQFYSDKLKEYTDCLVYIPYYSTSGGMAEAQEKCLAYYFVDYIVTQSEKYRKFFDLTLPEQKFLPYGSPKFDRVIRICNNPPEPPAEWKAKMEGKKVYFFNTSLNGMLADTEKFFKKMEYVFNCFEGRENACLLWRPHPLFETTIDSMRPAYRPIYDQLKKRFLDTDLGIYDDTPDITNTIAHCDAYIGDAGTSVTSLFGVAGKPMFLLGNHIHHLPEEDDWKPSILQGFSLYWGDEYRVTQGNKLYRAKDGGHHYRYVCDLHEYEGGGYYHPLVLPYKEKHFICPRNAQDILVVEDGQVVRKIALVREIEQAGAFYGLTILGKYLYLFPHKYPAIVRMNCETEEIQYIRGYNDMFVKWMPELGEWRFGAVAALPWDRYLKIYSPTEDEVIVIDNETGKVKVTSLGVSHHCGCAGLGFDGTDFWFLPYTGRTITRWNEKTGQIQEYSNLPEDFVCTNRPHGYRCEDRPFGGIFFHENYVYLAPLWGNMFLRFDKKTGEFEKWEPFFPVPEEPKNDYYPTWTRSGSFDWLIYELGKGHTRFYVSYESKLYDLDFNMKTYKEVEVTFDVEELRAHAAGFCIDSEWNRYCCWEDVFNTLPDFLEDKISGHVFSKEAQLASYAEINASCDGLCGQRVHERTK